MKRIRVIVAVLLAGGTLAIGVFDRYRRFAIEEASMHPTLLPGDWLLARRPVEQRIARGDIVVFESEGKAVVKRVVGLPGECVSIEAGVVCIDGTPIDDWWAGATRPDGLWPVPFDHLFVLGDNRPVSTDSRMIGFVPMVDVDSVAVFRYWPARRMQRLSAPPRPPNGAGATQRGA